MKIIRKGRTAKKWNTTEQFAAVYNEKKKTEVEAKKEMEKIAAMSPDDYKVFMFNEVKKDFPTAKQSESGLVYIIENEGEETKPVKGSPLEVHYKGTFRVSGEKFDSSYDRNQPMAFKYIEQRMIPGFTEGIGLIGKGGKAKLIIPYFAAYGAQGRPGAIPPYSDLVFDIEMINLALPVAGEDDGHEHHEGDGHEGHNH